MTMKISIFAVAAVYAVVLMFALFGLATAAVLPPTPSPVAGAGSLDFVPSVGSSVIASAIAFLAYMFF